MISGTREKTGQARSLESAHRAGTWALRALAFAALTAAGTGCYTATPNVIATPARLAPQPDADEATDYRAWPKSVALYHSGATQAWATRQAYTQDPDNTPASNVVTESLIFTASVVILPAMLIVDPPFKKIYYASDVLPPSYTANPPFPPEPVTRPPNPDPDPVVAPKEPVLPATLAPLEERPPLIRRPVIKPAKAMPTTRKSGAKDMAMPGKVSPTTKPAGK